MHKEIRYKCATQPAMNSIRMIATKIPAPQLLTIFLNCRKSKLIINVEDKKANSLFYL